MKKGGRDIGKKKCQTDYWSAMNDFWLALTYISIILSKRDT